MEQNSKSKILTTRTVTKLKKKTQNLTTQKLKCKKLKMGQKIKLHHHLKTQIVTKGKKVTLLHLKTQGLAKFRNINCNITKQKTNVNSSYDKTNKFKIHF